MPSWNELLNQFNATPAPARALWINQNLTASLQSVSKLRSDRNVLFYGSAFLQKPQTPAVLMSITHEDLNGLMSVVYGMDCSKGLTLILHTPGGITTAAETFVAYLRSKFKYVEVIVPTFAMSAGTMISLAADRIIMGRQSQLGPIDPQFSVGPRNMSARAVVDQFAMAKTEILGEVKLAHAWAPILQSIGPALLKEALDAIDYGKTMVSRWLAAYMLAGTADATAKADRIADYFNDAAVHKSHGRRIDRDEARAQGVTVDDLETDQNLQDAALTAYHIFSIAVQQSDLVKITFSNSGQLFLKNFNTQQLVQMPMAILT